MKYDVNIMDIGKQRWGIEHNLCVKGLFLTEYAKVICEENGFVLMEGNYLAREFPTLKMNGESITKKIRELVNKKILIPFEDEEIVKVIKNKRKYNEGNGIGPNVCEWCKGYTIKLHEHHYPISRKNGGKEVVNICPNCHYEFHHNSLYRINNDIVYK